MAHVHTAHGQPSLVLIVPDPDGLVHGAGGDDGLADAHVHARHLPVVEGVGEIVECRRTSTTALGRETRRRGRGKKWRVGIHVHGEVSSHTSSHTFTKYLLSIKLQLNIHVALSMGNHRHGFECNLGIIA